MQEAHDITAGEVGLRSVERVAAAFLVDLPEPQGALLVPAKATMDKRREGGLENANRLVVYIEDNPSNVALMQDVMEELIQVQLLTAPSAELGIELVRERLPDLVLMDINLPGMNGIDATKKLREWPETRDIPVVALTASAITPERKQSEIAVFDGYLTKPLKVDELTRTLEQLFERARPPSLP